MKIKKLYLTSLFAVSIGVFVPVLLFVPKISAATFVVDSVADDNDTFPGDGNCDNGSGDCTLRAAIEESNNLDGDDTVEFNIAGAGTHTITPSTELPTVTEAITIDGSTQPGSSCGTLVPVTLPTTTNSPHTILIEIDGQLAPSGNGLEINGQALEVGTVDIRGLSIGGFSGSASVAIRDDFNDDDLELDVSCAYMGTESDGTTANPNIYGLTTQGVLVRLDNVLLSGNGVGALVELSNTTISNSIVGLNSLGTSAVSNTGSGLSLIDNSELTLNHNIVSGNQAHGVEGNNSSITASGNYIGISMVGSPLGNAQSGIEASGPSSFQLLGNSNRNIISANGENGVHVFTQCNGSYVNSGSIIGNYIGTDTNGEVSSGFGNTGDGVRVNEFNGSCATVKNIKIGGVESGYGNTIAGNGGNGVFIYQTAATDVFGISVIKNSIFGNGALGIDLATDQDDDGIADGDIGINLINNLAIAYPTPIANYFLNSPKIHSYSLSEGKMIVKYDYQAKSVQESHPEIAQDKVVGYRLDFYLSDSKTNQQGKTHIGSFIIDGSEVNASHMFDYAGLVPNGSTVTATATILWKSIPENINTPCGGVVGAGPPYWESTNGCPN